MIDAYWLAIAFVFGMLLGSALGRIELIHDDLGMTIRQYLEMKRKRRR